MSASEKDFFAHRYFDFMKNTYRTMLHDLAVYHATFRNLQMTISGPEFKFAADTEEKYPRAASPAPKLFKEIDDLGKKIKEQIKVAVSLKKAAEDGYMKSVRENFNAEAHKRIPKILAQVWDVKRYQAIADDLRETLGAALLEISHDKKKNSRFDEKYEHFFLSRNADIATVVGAVNEILKNPGNYNKKFVKNISQAIAERFGGAHQYISSPLKLHSDSARYKPQIVFDIKAASATIYEAFIHKMTHKSYGAAHELTAATLEIEKGGMLSLYRRKILKYLEVRFREINLSERISAAVDDLLELEKKIISADVKDINILHDFEDLKKLVNLLADPGTSFEHAEAMLKKMEKRKLEVLDEIKSQKDLAANKKPSQHMP